MVVSVRSELVNDIELFPNTGPEKCIYNLPPDALRSPFCLHYDQHDDQPRHYKSYYYRHLDRHCHLCLNYVHDNYLLKA